LLPPEKIPADAHEANHCPDRYQRPLIYTGKDLYTDNLLEELR